LKETIAPNKKERYRPAVKFRKIDKALLEKLQTGARASESNLDKNILVQEEAAEIQDDDSDDEELAEENLQGGVGRDGGTDGLKLAFAVDSQIDLNSRALLDMISEEAVIINQSLAPAREKTAGEMSIDEAFDNW
jgi:hypothetical protein